MISSNKKLFVKLPTGKVDSTVNEQLDSLRKQLKQLEAERDILKKALSIFSRPT